MIQPDLIPNLRPAEIVISGPETVQAIASIKQRGGKITVMERLDKHSTKWRLLIYWPDKK
jgi:hypothetical protein